MAAQPAPRRGGRRADGGWSRRCTTVGCCHRAWTSSPSTPRSHGRGNDSLAAQACFPYAAVPRRTRSVSETGSSNTVVQWLSVSTRILQSHPAAALYDAVVRASGVVYRGVLEGGSGRVRLVNPCIRQKTDPGAGELPVVISGKFGSIRGMANLPNRPVPSAQCPVPSAQCPPTKRTVHRSILAALFREARCIVAAYATLFQSANQNEDEELPELQTMLAKWLQHHSLHTRCV